MKISEMTNDQATEAMIRISAALSVICDDDEIMDVINELQNLGDITLIKAIPKILPKFTTLAFRKHKNDLYEIVGALSQKPYTEVGQMKFGESVAIIKDSYDEILKDFFTTSVRSQRTNVKESV